MNITLTIEDRDGGLDVSCVGFPVAGQPNGADSLAAIAVAQFAELLRVSRKLGVKITEKGEKATWLDE